jgi:hypothetical protein
MKSTVKIWILTLVLAAMMANIAVAEDMGGSVGDAGSSAEVSTDVGGDAADSPDGGEAPAEDSVDEEEAPAEDSVDEEGGSG